MADYGDQSDTLDPAQIEKAIYDKEKIAQRVLALDNLVPEDFDEIDYNYIAVGNGVGEVGLMVFKKATQIVAAISFTYDANHRCINTKRI